MLPLPINPKKKLGQLAFNRLRILELISVGSHVESNKEQLREIEKQMVILGWDSTAHTVIMTSDGPRIKPQRKNTGIIIRVKPFLLSGNINYH